MIPHVPCHHQAWRPCALSTTGKTPCISAVGNVVQGTGLPSTECEVPWFLRVPRPHPPGAPPLPTARPCPSISILLPKIFLPTPSKNSSSPLYQPPWSGGNFSSPDPFLSIKKGTSSTCSSTLEGHSPLTRFFFSSLVAAAPGRSPPTIDTSRTTLHSLSTSLSQSPLRRSSFDIHRARQSTLRRSLSRFPLCESSRIIF